MNLFERDKEFFLNTYNRIPIEVDHGQGAFIFDKSGNKYLDFFSGLAVNALGYAHPRIVKAVSEQIAKFGHLSNNFITDVQVEFAERMLKASGMHKIFLANSGTEANEGVIKLVRMKYGPEKTIYSMTDSFHGRTYGALSLTARSKYRKGFEPLLDKTGSLKHNDLEDLEATINAETAAVILEFIQGEGGINEVSKEYVEKLFSLREKFGFLIIADAIQDGIGRTGKPFAHDYYGQKPDIIVTAKAIGGGLPLGAFMTSSALSDVFSVGQHGTTFGGNPVCCAAGNIVLDEIFEKGLINDVFELGMYLKEGLLGIQKDHPEKVKETRGKGFMQGVELFFEGADLVKKMREKGILTNCTNNNVIRLLPPLIVSKQEIDMFLESFNKTLGEI